MQASQTYNLSILSVFEQKVSLKRFLIVGILVIVFLLSLYIYQVQEYTRAGFGISTYEKQIGEITRDQKNLEVNFSETNSLANLEALLKSVNYEEVGRVKYIKMTSWQVAAK